MDLVVRADEGALRLQRVGEGSHVQRHDVGGLLHLPAVQQPVHQSPGQVALGTETVDSATEGRNGGEVVLSGMTDTDLEFTGVEQSNKCITSPPHPPPALPTIEAYGSAHGKEKKFLKTAARQYLSGTALTLTAAKAWPGPGVQGRCPCSSEATRPQGCSGHRLSSCGPVSLLPVFLIPFPKALLILQSSKKDIKW